MEIDSLKVTDFCRSNIFRFNVNPFNLNKPITFQATFIKKQKIITTSVIFVKSDVDGWSGALNDDKTKSSFTSKTVQEPKVLSRT